MNAFKNQHLSVSRVRRYEQCPLAFKLHYIDRRESEPGPALRFGSMMHAVLERLYRWVVAEEHVGPLDEGLALDLYRDEWIRSGLLGFATYDEGFRILRAYLSAHPVVDHRDVLAVEQAFQLDIDGFAMVGQLDRVDRVGDDAIEILDYKTNRAIYTRDELASDLQLTVYALAARTLWPWAKEVRLGFYLLRHGMRMMTERTDEQLEAARAYVASLGRQTEQTSDFPPRLQTNCCYCDHRQHCPAYSEAIAGRVEVVPSTPDDLESVAREREEVASLARILYRRKDELDSVLKAKLDEDGEVELAGRRYSLYPMAQHVAYPVDATVRAFTEVTGWSEVDLRTELLAIDKRKLDALVKRLGSSLPRAQHRLLKLHLDSVATKTYSPRLSARKVS